jgi:hypothetical protein
VPGLRQANSEAVRDCDRRTDEIVKNRVWWDLRGLLLVVRNAGEERPRREVESCSLEDEGSTEPEKGDGWRERGIHLWHWRRLC